MPKSKVRKKPARHRTPAVARGSRYVVGQDGLVPMLAGPRDVQAALMSQDERDAVVGTAARSALTALAVGVPSQTSPEDGLPWARAAFMVSVPPTGVDDVIATGVWFSSESGSYWSHTSAPISAQCDEIATMLLAEGVGQSGASVIGLVRADGVAWIEKANVAAESDFLGTLSFGEWLMFASHWDRIA